MQAPTPERLPLREYRAREKARPELNREHRDILVGRSYGQRFLTFLQQNGIRGLVVEESFSDIITLGCDTDLDHVESLITAWMNGADFQQP